MLVSGYTFIFCCGLFLLFVFGKVMGCVQSVYVSVYFFNPDMNELPIIYLHCNKHTRSKPICDGKTSTLSFMFKLTVSLGFLWNTVHCIEE